MGNPSNDAFEALRLQIEGLQQEVRESVVERQDEMRESVVERQEVSVLESSASTSAKHEVGISMESLA